jgi:glycerophosphodiester phosphodiesterase
MLTRFKFLHVSDGRTPRESRPASPSQNGDQATANIRKSTTRRHRSMSVGGSEYSTAEMSEKMKHTRDFKKKGFKGNSRGNHIQAPFATLEELFKKLPPSVGFNIEMSMFQPTLGYDKSWMWCTKQ